LTLAKQRKLSAKYGFKVVSGFGDRVIFKELFLDGLTLSHAGLSPKAHCFTLFLTEIISLIHLKFRNILTNNKEILYDKEIKFIS